MIRQLSLFTLMGCFWIAGAQQGNGNGPGGNDLGNGNAYGPIHETYSKGNAGRGGGGTPPITYHGGPVMPGTVSVYYIWYGNWAGNTAIGILQDLASSIGNSSYFNINQTYSTVTPPQTITGLVSRATEVYDPNYTYGKNLSDTAIANIVSWAISHGLPKDANGVYFVLTSEDVNETSGFCSRYCGWHTYGTLGGTPIKYAFVGNPARCLSSCAAQSVGPNGNAGADGMASIIAHELEEAVTDPQLNAWYDNRGYENADKCAWTFGTTYPVNGAQANVRLGSRDYLIQRNWSAATQSCAMSK